MMSTERSSTGIERALLAGAAVAGPLYLVVGLVQAFTRPGFDITRHDLSLLANGDLGWIQMSNLVVSGLLVIAGAFGMRQALRSGPARTWGPLLVAVYGVGLVGAGFFTADPALGFPPGTPADARAISWHGLLHFVTGGIGFLALIAACLLIARRLAGEGRPGWAAYSAASGVVFLAGFVGIIVGSGQGLAILGLWIGVVVAWAWITATALRLMGGDR